MAKGVRWTGVGSEVGEMPRADLLKSGHWRAVYLETRQHGSGRGGWNRARSRLAVTAEANGRVNELRRKPSTSSAAYSTRRRTDRDVVRDARRTSQPKGITMATRPIALFIRTHSPPGSRATFSKGRPNPFAA